MSVYLRVAVIGSLIMLLAVFISNINDDMQDVTIQDIKQGYENPVYGQPLNSPAGNDGGNHTLMIADYEIPLIGELLYFITFLINMIWTVISTIISVLVDIAMISTKFPSFLSPLIVMMQALLMLCWYKVLMPSGSG